MIRAQGDALMAEHLVAAHLHRAGCDLARDVPLPSGSSADLAVVRDGLRFHAHVKWLSHVEGRSDERGGAARSAAAAQGAAAAAHRAKDADEIREMAPARLGPIPRELRSLQTIDRGIEVAIRWRPGAGCAAFRRMVNQLAPFLRSARVSEERVARDARGQEIGRVRVVAPRIDGARVKLVDERLVERRILQAARGQRLLRKALAQFMPRSTNVIVMVGSDFEQSEALDLALHGSIIEDWSRFPPRGERVAHGRADDGFWSRGRASGSNAVAWMLASGTGRPTRRVLWLRDGARIAAPMRQLLVDLFDDGRGVRAPVRR